MEIERRPVTPEIRFGPASIIEQKIESLVNNAPIIEKKIASLANNVPIIEKKIESLVNKAPVMEQKIESLINNVSALLTSGLEPKSVPTVTGVNKSFPVKHLWWILPGALFVGGRYFPLQKEKEETGTNKSLISPGVFSETCRGQ